MIKRLLNKIKRTFKSSDKFILIYQMGKVASTSVYLSLRDTKSAFIVKHFHRLSPQNIEGIIKFRAARSIDHNSEQNALYFYNTYIAKGTNQIKFITLVREPISRNVSAYFENSKNYGMLSEAIKKGEITNLTNEFLEKYSHNVPGNWYQNEFEPTTGINVFDHNFPKEKGYQIIKNGRFEVLIMRHDLSDEIKEKVIGEYTGIPNFRLISGNKGEDKSYSELYKEFKKNVKLPKDYCLEMLESEYSRHFYTEDELNDVWNKWCLEKKDY